jgi:predicted  nucleic acid-binding Zn-ribbon protein
MKRVEGHSDLRRAANGAIVNTDRNALKKAKAQKAKDQELKALRSDVEELKRVINTLQKQLEEVNKHG